MKRFLLVLFGLGSLFCNPAHAEIAAIRAAQAQIVARIGQLQQALGAYVNQVNANVAQVRRAADQAIVVYQQQYGAADGQARQQAGAAAYGVQQQGASAITAAYNGLVNHLNYVARVAPWSYAAVYAQAVAAFNAYQNEVHAWVSSNLNGISQWLTASLNGLYQWYLAMVTPIEQQYQAVRNAGNQQINAVAQATQNEVTQLQAQYVALEQQAAASACGLPIRYPVTSCQLISTANGSVDVYFIIQTSQGARGFRMYLPPNFRGPAPLVFNFHGYGGSSAVQRTIGNFIPWSNQLGFILIEPDGYANSWNAGACCGAAVSSKIDDVAFVRTIIDWILGYGIVNSGKIFAAGLSNGGMMVQRLASELSEYMAGVVTVTGPNGQYPGGVYPSNELAYAGNQTRPVPILMAYGTIDPLVLYFGGPVVLGGQRLFSAISAEANFQAWSRGNRCADGSMQLAGRNGSTYFYQNPSCGSGRKVVLATVVGGGHEWFNAGQGMDMTATAIGFFFSL